MALIPVAMGYCLVFGLVCLIIFGVPFFSSLSWLFFGFLDFNPLLNLVNLTLVLTLGRYNRFLGSFTLIISGIEIYIQGSFLLAALLIP